MVAGHTLHLHIGLPKTASTWLQDALYPRLDHLTVRSVPRSRLFTAAGDAEVGYRIFACALRRSAAVWEARGEAIFEALLGARTLVQSGDVLVSDETIGRAASRPEALAAHLVALRRAARGWGFGRLRVLAIVRRQDTWLASHYAQVSDRAQTAGQADFERMVAATIDIGCDRYGFGMLLDYAALHVALCQSVGAENVLTLPFERFREAPAEALEEVLRWLGTPAGSIAAHLTTAMQQHANVRAQQGAQGVSWRLRPPSVRVLGLRRLRVPAAVWPRRSIHLPPALSLQILSAYREANASLAETTGLDLGRYGYLPAPTSAAASPATRPEPNAAPTD